jgi:hypothetical protein
LFCNYSFFKNISLELLLLIGFQLLITSKNDLFINKYQILILERNMESKIILAISIIGFSGGFLVPIFGIMESISWGEIISNRMYFVLFIIFALLSLFGIILCLLTRKGKDNFRRYSFILSVIGLCINGFLVLCGLPGLLY